MNVNKHFVWSYFQTFLVKLTLDKKNCKAVSKAVICQYDRLNLSELKRIWSNNQENSHNFDFIAHRNHIIRIDFVFWCMIKMASKISKGDIPLDGRYALTAAAACISTMLDAEEDGSFSASRWMEAAISGFSMTSASTNSARRMTIALPCMVSRWWLTICHWSWWKMPNLTMSWMWWVVFRCCQSQCQCRFPL